MANTILREKNGRLSALEDKLNSLSSKSKLSKLSEEMVYTLERKVQYSEQKLDEEIVIIENTLKQYKNLLKSYEGKKSENINRFSLMFSQKSNEIKSLKNKISLYLKNEQSEKIKREESIIHDFEKKLQIITNVLVKQIQKRKNHFNELETHISQTIPKSDVQIGRSVQEMRSHLKDMESQLQASYDEMKENMKKQSQICDEREKKLITFLKTIVIQIESSLQQQKMERQKNKEKLVYLLNQTNQRLLQ